MTKSIRVVPTLMVAQPWAQLIINGTKDIENRSRGCNYRGTVALYASKTIQKNRFSYAAELGHIFNPSDLQYGVVLGFVDIADAISSKNLKGYKGEWYDTGSIGIWLKNPIMLKKPIKVVFPYGTINWGKLKGKALQNCLNQLTAKQINKIKPAT